MKKVQNMPNYHPYAYKFQKLTALLWMTSSAVLSGQVQTVELGYYGAGNVSGKQQAQFTVKRPGLSLKQP